MSSRAVKLSPDLGAPLIPHAKKCQAAVPFPVLSFSSNFLLAASTISSLLLFNNACRSTLLVLHPPFSLGAATAVCTAPSALAPRTTPTSAFPPPSIVDAVDAVGEDEGNLDVKLYRVMRSVNRGFGCCCGAATRCDEDVEADDEAGSG